MRCCTCGGAEPIALAIWDAHIGAPAHGALQATHDHGLAICPVTPERRADGSGALPRCCVRAFWRLLQLTRWHAEQVVEALQVHGRGPCRQHAVLCRTLLHRGWRNDRGTPLRNAACQQIQFGTSESAHPTQSHSTNELLACQLLKPSLPCNNQQRRTRTCSCE